MDQVTVAMVSKRLYRVAVVKDATQPFHRKSEQDAREDPSCEIYWIAADTLIQAAQMALSVGQAEFGGKADVFEIDFKQNRVIV